MDGGWPHHTRDAFFIQESRFETRVDEWRATSARPCPRTRRPAPPRRPRPTRPRPPATSPAPRRRVTQNHHSTDVEWTKNHNRAKGTCSYDGLEYSTTNRVRAST